MIEIDGLTKRYGDKTAVDGLSFVVEPGVVTGFLGPNGAGKSTTMRMIAGLDRPDSGTVRVNGKHYPKAPAPMAELGILLDARSVHPGLSARSRWQSRHALSGGLAFPLSEGLNDDRPVRSRQPAQVIGISSLYDAATCFDGHGDGMSVCEESGIGTCLGEERSDQASQRPVGVTEQQSVSRLPGEERVQRLIASGSPERSFWTS